MRGKRKADMADSACRNRRSRGRVSLTQMHSKDGGCVVVDSWPISKYLRVSLHCSLSQVSQRSRSALSRLGFQVV